jgi:hypothetical protein
MKRILVSLLVALVMVVGMALPAFAATTATVTVTATPTYIALTNSVNTWAMGTVAESSTYWWATGDVEPDPNDVYEAADMKSEIENTGSVAEDIDIKVAAFTGGVGWAISTDATPGADEISIRAAITGGSTAALIQVITTDTELKDNLAAAGKVKWMMQGKTGTFSDGVAKSGTVTLTASAAN